MISGRVEAFDREPHPRGNRILLARGPDKRPLALPFSVAQSWLWAFDGTNTVEPEIRYIAHVATCPEVE